MRAAQRLGRVAGLAPAALNARAASSLQAQPPNVELARSSMPWSKRLLADLRSDHAGETGAVWIYKGAAAAQRLRGHSAEAREFVGQHLESEQQHLDFFDDLLEAQHTTKLLPLWRACGFVLGFAPAMVGEAALFATVEAVETFVEEHYDDQLAYLRSNGEMRSGDHAGRHAEGNDGGVAELVRVIAACRDDEVSHKNDAASRGSPRQAQPVFVAAAVRAWARVIDAGSRLAVVASRAV